MTNRLLAGLTALLVFSIAAPAFADSQKTRFIAVEGKGTVTAIPDIASINTGVTTRAETARAALTANNKAMNSLFRQLSEAGIDEKDIRTSNFSVSPHYERYERNKPRRIAGYQAANHVTVTVRDLKQLGRLLDAVVSAGSNRVNGVQFSVAEPEKLLDQARRKAVKDAMRRAHLYADAAGAGLGKILQIQERGTRYPRPRMRAAEAVRSDKSVPVSRGTQTLSATVGIRIELE
ncbi:MAG: DUF541 domain-containing protein [Alphaproteobacteria bacterium]|nr:DUF541 domain-containing protein [Alphaproteobacteria bacterium]